MVFAALLLQLSGYVLAAVVSKHAEAVTAAAWQSCKDAPFQSLVGTEVTLADWASSRQGRADSVVGGEIHKIAVGHCLGGGAYGAVFKIEGINGRAVLKVFGPTMVEKGAWGSSRYDAKTGFERLRALRIQKAPRASNAQLMDRGRAILAEPHYDGMITIGSSKRYAQVLEAAEGKSIHELLYEREKGSPQVIMPSSFFKIASDMCAVLYYLAAANMFHNDMQPSNFMWDEEMQKLTLIDFDTLDDIPVLNLPSRGVAEDTRAAFGTMADILAELTEDEKINISEYMKVAAWNEAFRQGRKKQALEKLVPDHKAAVADAYNVLLNSQRGPDEEKVKDHLSRLELAVKTLDLLYKVAHGDTGDVAQSATGDAAIEKVSASSNAAIEKVPLSSRIQKKLASVYRVVASHVTPRRKFPSGGESLVEDGAAAPGAEGVQTPEGQDDTCVDADE